MGIKLIWGLVLIVLLVSTVSAGIKYTPSTEENCIDNKCTLNIYSGIRFVEEDNQWKKVENARSLKGSGIGCNVIEDEITSAECLDYNYTSIKVKIKLKDNSKKNKDIPIKIKNKEEKKIKFSLNDEEQIHEINIDFGEELHIGENSTTIVLGDNSSENLADSYIDESNPNNNYATIQDLQLSNNSFGGDESDSKWILMKFNITLIPESANIDNAELSLFKSGDSLDSGEWLNITSHLVYTNHSWKESLITWNSYNPISGINFNAIPSDKVQLDNNVDGAFYLNVTSILNQRIGKNLTILLKGAEHHSSVAYNDYVTIYSRERGTISQRPKLNITYSISGDGNAPTLNILYPVNQTTYSLNITEMNFTAIDDLNNLSSCWWTDDLGITNTTVTCGNNVTGQNWGNGTTLTVYANDTGNQVGSDTIIFYVDITLPNGTLISPINNFNTSDNTQNFTFNLSDDTGLKNGSLSIFTKGGGLYNNTFVNEITDLTLTTLGIVVYLVDGVYDWFVDVFDSAGNYFQTGNYTLTVDTTAPTVTLVAPSDGLTTTVQTHSFNATCSDGTSNLDTGKFYLWDSSNNLESSDTFDNPATMNKTFALPDFDTFHWNYWCNDSLNNEGFANANRTITYQSSIEPINWTETDNCFLVGNLSNNVPMTKICNNGYVYLTSPNGSKFRCGVTNAGGWSCTG